MVSFQGTDSHLIPIRIPKTGSSNTPDGAVQDLEREGKNQNSVKVVTFLDQNEPYNEQDNINPLQPPSKSIKRNRSFQEKQNDYRNISLKNEFA